ncbi:trehalase-like isoform X3 [Lycorma delicatula]|uniref:trehalase-like isoform X3 n=1 Tax=Lycorma delicatula TaxID=130591 RepID=UPI003F518AAA
MESYLLVVFNLVVLFIVTVFTTDCRTTVSVSPNYLNTKFKKLCKSKIYCEGELLHDVQLSHLFKDSKIFVDFKLKFPEDEILTKYKDLKQKGTLRRKEIRKFVEENFERGNELEQWVPEDWTKEPNITKRISSEAYKKWVLHLNTMWRVLARKVKKEVKENPNMFSLLYVPNGFIIPGGRFTELYYWDTYWIIKGLLLCDMPVSVKGIIENLLYLVKFYGLVPNGSRVYYLTRSQPPLLIQMVDVYYKRTDDWDFVKKNLKYLSLEFDYWWENHMITVEKDGKYYKLARYFSYVPTPRPESYREDYLIAQEVEVEEEYYIKIRSAAETGWDFSSRWFIDQNCTNEGTLSNVAAPQIVPVDLNSFLQLNAEILGDYYARMGNTNKAKEYFMKGKQLLDGITAVLWHEDLGIWLDYDSVNREARKYFYASNFTPLFTSSYYKTWSKSILSKKIIGYLKLNSIGSYLGGVPTSLEETGEQWDFPNAWGPLQSIIIQGLDKLGTEASVKEAYKLADRWIRSNYEGFKISHTMYEKYDALRPGETGEGGEYVPQTGFGWTNGVVLELLDKYGSSKEFDVEAELKMKYPQDLVLEHFKRNRLKKKDHLIETDHKKTIQ